MALFTDNWVRVFDIPETSKHLKGFTLYKIVSIVYPKTCPDAVTKVTVWKRYNDFKKLHRELKLRHKSMQIEDKFPVLLNTSYFKRFDSEVINQRKNSLLTFLEYIALHPPLFKSIEFVKFFETSHTPQESLNSNINIIRAQLNLPNDPEIIYPFNSDDDQGPSDSDSISAFSIASTSLIQPDESSILDIRSVSSHTNLSQIVANSAQSKIPSPDSVSNKSMCKYVYPTPPSTPDFVIAPELCSSAQYLSSAAVYVNKATQYELEKKYNEAFTTYKNGISCLLDGVKGDKDANRRQMVRHKIEKYLLRAEKIYNLYLSPEITQLRHICRSESDSTNYSIRRPVEDLFNYKVLKIIDNGMVVLHKKEHNVFYLKVIPKSPQLFDSVYLNIPKDVPYMVQLFQYYDTNTAVIIVIQYVSGGRLFDFIKQKSSTPHNEAPTKYSSVTFEKDVSELLEDDLDFSDSSECSYSDLITEYTTSFKKNKHATLYTLKPRVESSYSLETHFTSNDDFTEASTATQNLDTLETDNSKTDTEAHLVNNQLESTNVSLLNPKLESLHQNGIETEPDNVNQLLNKSHDLLSSVNETLVGDNLTNKGEANKEVGNRATFQRTISEKSFSEEFNSVSYIPPQKDIVKWAAQLLLAIEKLHKVGVVIADLNTSNLLLDEKGNLLLTFICNFRDKGKLLCNKYENINTHYCAPEIFSLQHPVTFAADWWSYGAILFEILTGMPLMLVHPEGIWNYTLLKIPKYVSPEGKSLLKQLIVYEAQDRLGCGINGTRDLKSHPFFSSVDWIKMQVEAFKT